MGLLVKPAPVGAIKRPVRRLLLPTMTPLLSLSLSSSAPPVCRARSLPLYAFLLGENDRENCARRGGGSHKGVP